MNTNQYYNFYQKPFQPQFLKGFQVASIDEAKAANIDFDGSVFIFPDLTNHKIYTKQIMMDGTLAFNVYELAALPQQQTPTIDEFVTRTELQELLGLIQNKQETNSAKMSEEQKRELASKF